VFLGVEVLFLGGSGSKTISGIPGTFGPGGIATSAAAANDSTTVKFGGSTDLIGRIGTVVPVGNFGVMVSLDGGISWQDASLRLECTAPGACGTNGLPAQSLSVSKTLTGPVIGAEVNVPLLPLFGFQTSANPTWFSGTTVGFQYLHGDYGTKTSTLGVPSQLQIVANQRITTDLFMARVTVPLGDPFMWVRQGGVWVQQPQR